MIFIYKMIKNNKTSVISSMLCQNSTWEVELVGCTYVYVYIYIYIYTYYAYIYMYMIYYEAFT